LIDCNLLILYVLLPFSGVALSLLFVSVAAHTGQTLWETSVIVLKVQS